MRNERFLKGAVFPLIAGILVLLIAGCTDFSSLQKPESVTIASHDGVFEFPLGNASSSFEDYVNLSTLQESLGGEDAVFEVYDYWPNRTGNVMQFLMNYQIADIPLDFGELLNDSDFIGDINEDLTQTLTIDPDTSVTLANVAFDLNAGIKEHFDVHPVDTDVPVIEVSTEVAFPENLARREIEITAPSFSTLDFETGKFRITFEKTDNQACTDGFIISLSATLLDESGNEISSSGSSVEVQDGGTIELDMAGKSMTTHMTVVFSGVYGNGANLSVQHSYKIVTGLSSDTTFSRVTGLTMNSSDLGEYGTFTIPETAIDLSSLEDYLLEATVKEGSFDFLIPVADWSGVTTDTELIFTGEQIPLSAEDITDGGESGYLVNKKIDLAGKKIDLSLTPTKVNGTISLSLDNATVTPTSSGALILTGVCNLKSLTDAKVKIANVIDTSVMTKHIEKDLSDNQAATMVKEVVFTRVGFTGDITCDLPMSGLVVTPSFTSTVFGISDPLTQDIEFADGKGAIDMSTDVSSVRIVPATDLLDFDVAMSVTGKDTATGQATEYVLISELEIAREYTFAPHIELDYDIDYVKFNLNSDVASLDKEIDTNINVHDMIFGDLDGLNDILTNIKMADSLMAYLTISRPEFKPSETVSVDPLASLEGFSGTISALYEVIDSEGDSHDMQMYLVGDESDDADIPLVARTADYATIATDSLITQELFKEGTYSAAIDVFDTLLNEDPNNLRLKCNITLSGTGGDDGYLTLTSDQIKCLTQIDTGGAETTKLGVSLAIVLPFEFELVNGGIQIDDLLATAGKELTDDLLKRDSADDSKTEKVKKYSDIVRAIQLNYSIDNRLLVGTDIEVGMKFFDQDDPDTAIYKPLVLDAKSHTFQLTNAEIDQCLDFYPLNFKVSLSVGQGAIYIPRMSSFGFNGTLSVTTDGEVTVWGGD